MNDSQFFAAAALISAVVDFLALAAVAWRYRTIIKQSRALQAIYPLCWGVFGLFGWFYFHIVFNPATSADLARETLRPVMVFILNTLLAVAILATLHGAKVAAQATELLAAHREAAEREKTRLAAEKEWLNERKSLLVVIGHELRTPINLITGYLSLLTEVLPAISRELAADTEVVDHLRQFTEGAISGAARLRVMVRMFDATSDAPKVAPINLCEIVYRAVADPDLYVATRRRPENVPITVSCASLYVQADGNMVETAVFELVRNALKATPSGGILITVSLAGEETAVIAVEDNGRGVPANITERIWEPGYQNAEDYRTRHNEGSGYGLAMVRHVARLHGGDAALEWTELEAGSRFAIYLPT